MEAPLYDMYKDVYGQMHITHGPGKPPPDWRFVGKVTFALRDENGEEMSTDEQKEMLGA